MDGKPQERDVLDLGDAAADKAPADQLPAPERKLGVPAWVHEAEASQSAAAELQAQPAADAPSGSAVASAAAGSAIPAEELELLTADIVGALKTVYDPEIPADIYELGLIYRIDIDDSRFVNIDMTLTAPGCPVAGEMPIWVENAVTGVPGVAGCKVKLTFDPPWTQDRMSDEARLAINMF